MNNTNAPSFWRPGTTAPGSTLDRVSANEESPIDPSIYSVHSQTRSTQSRDELSRQRKQLPVYKYRQHLLYAMEKFRTIIVVGETGCGKTTQLPQYLAEVGWSGQGKMIACTQPRRVAATSVALRVAEEVGCRIGGKVGYSVRFDNAEGATTQIKYMTDGMLVRETLMDPLLQRYSTIMVDEAHERGLYTDVLLGLLRKIMKKRSDLRVIVSSATLDAEAFAEFFETNDDLTAPENNTATILSVEGRMHHVDIHYRRFPVPNYMQACADSVMQIHSKEGAGDVLVFLTGQDEVDQVVDMLSDRASSVSDARLRLLPMPLYASLPSEMQMRVFQPVARGCRKVVIATNIAETSVTIPNIVFVVDSGFAKIRAYNPVSGLEALVVTPVSKASAKQRAGRAGRVKPGKAYRLYTLEDYKSLEDQNVPEIQRSNLGQVVLQLKALGIQNIVRFDYLSPPPPDSLIRSMDLLHSLGAITDEGELSEPLGERMVECPLEPKLAKILLMSGEMGCSEEILTIVAMLQVQNIFVSPTNKRREADNHRRLFTALEGDHLSLLNAYTTFHKNKQSSGFCQTYFLNRRSLLRATEIRKQLLKFLRRFNIPICSTSDTEIIRRCITGGFFANCARLSGDGVCPRVMCHLLHELPLRNYILLLP
ncbi:ATP-dependent RNA helicase DHX35, variant [Sphaeroforma arctica JP610]|uniref:RNA helicase n=1 Tax=Sphaeroforma arctica JP610 TaxID=667725 RepID=A0A0L0G3H2_9EUKA|nr:ATP-dependent RNA helicase DHX35, variant [Sphaeroforma arctica JP610]KNC83419.1 ATP-dependent RNA helicase DHX35, variant [Sphaeroforma arctica JP610]|eukprot:XP_014157321.1 ATP-dependent RNA helicase DHX35, variant [Sphaeroforma arctica JP610]